MGGGAHGSAHLNKLTHHRSAIKRRHQPPTGHGLASQHCLWRADARLLRPGLQPSHAVHDALNDLIDTLRDYVDDWNDRLLEAPNHRDNWPLEAIARMNAFWSASP